MKALKARWDKTALGVPPPDVLTERCFKAWTTELVVVAGIKIFRKDETTL